MKRPLLKFAFFYPFTASLFIFCSGEIAFGQDNSRTNTENLHRDMNAIASDATKGRFTGTPGHLKAAHYTANEFKKAGLKPGLTGGKGEKTYFQPVPFNRDNYGPATSLTLVQNGKTKRFDHSAGDFVFLHHGVNYKQVPSTAPVFIGYGIEESKAGWDDFKGLDVRGRWVIILGGIPPADSIRLARYKDWDTCEALKYKALIRHKVAGVIVVPDERESGNWENTAIRRYRFGYMQYADAGILNDDASEYIMPYILAGPDLAQTIFLGQSYDPVTKTGDYHSYILKHTSIDVRIDYKKELIYSPNIIAVVPGTDTSLSKEYITISGHLDHLGKFRDHVYNGANDDASACVIILEAARAIALKPLKRPVMFILFTGEELGMTGSDYFTKHLPIPPNNISLNINIEQIGSKSRTFPGVWAIGDPQFKKAFYKSGGPFADNELKFDGIKEMEDAIRNCDTYNFHNKNIPSVLLSSGGFNEYHQPTDKIDLIDFDHLQNAALLLTSFIVELGNK